MSESKLVWHDKDLCQIIIFLSSSPVIVMVTSPYNEILSNGMWMQVLLWNLKHNFFFFWPGTHWVWEIIVMLLKGSAEYHPLTREHAFLDIIDDLSSLDSLPSPRVFNTHVPYRWLPREHFKAGRKFVNVIRNPKDVAVSWYCHWHSSNELGCGSLSWSEFFEEVVVGQCN